MISSLHAVLSPHFLPAAMMKASYYGYKTANTHDIDIWGDEDVKENESAPRDPLYKTIVLCIVSVVHFYRPSHNDFILGGSEIHTILYQLRVIATVTATLSLFFWIWAIHNTWHMKKGVDLGIYSFPTTLVSSHWLLWKTRHESNIFLATITLRVLVTASHGFVTCNYLLGLLYSLTVGSNIYYGFGLYCLIFAMLWGGCTLAGWWLLLQLHTMEEGGLSRGGPCDEDDPLGLGDNYY